MMRSDYSDVEQSKATGVKGKLAKQPGFLAVSFFI